MILRRHSLYMKFRYPFLLRHRKIFAVLVLLIVVVVFLHCYLLPKVSGAYNDECYLSKEKYKNLLYAVQTIGKTMEKHNITYWLDFGTLLGAIRYGDIIPWDGDADISFLLDDEKYALHQELLNQHGISSNGLIAGYRGESIDYVRWKKKRGIYYGKEVPLLLKFYPQSVLKNELTIIKYDRLAQTIPLSWVIPTKQIDFRGLKLRIPNEYHKVLGRRYPFTYLTGLSVPYKWKCWVPCWIRTANGC